MRLSCRGIGIDAVMVANAIKIYDKAQKDVIEKLKVMTSLENPRSVVQMQSWLRSNGINLESLGQKELAKETISEPYKSVLNLWQQLAMSAVKKYQAMDAAVCPDGRLRGMFRFYGANRTGRFSGAIVQLQNLYRNSLPDLAQARELVKLGDYEALNALYDSVPEVLAECVRTAFIPQKGMKFIVADFSAIEARVVAYIAGEDWKIDAFREGKDIYCETASKMFHKTVVKHGENGELRQLGKVCELACGYSGSVKALEAFGALENGMNKEDLQPLVNMWRTANSKIVRLWYDVDKAAKEAIKEKTIRKIHDLTFTYKGGMMYITLPSGRRLSYVKPQIGKNKFGSESIEYMGLNIAKQWSKLETFGGKLVENITQAISRDILCHAMFMLKDYRICAHVHDEIIAECPMNTSVKEVCEKMATTPKWCKDLPLKADGYECKFYRKD